MSRRWILGVTLGAALTGASALAQVRPAPGPLVGPRDVPTCARDTDAQVQSRRDALEAVRQINNAAHAFHRYQKAYPTWQQLAESSPAAVPGARVHVAWGSPEPVPGWQIDFVTNQKSYLFTLRGTEDVCGVVLTSGDSAGVIVGHDTGYHAGLVPLSTR